MTDIERKKDPWRAALNHTIRGVLGQGEVKRDDDVAMRRSWSGKMQVE